MWICKNILIQPQILLDHNSRTFPNRMMLDTDLMVLNKQIVSQSYKIHHLTLYGEVGLHCGYNL